MKYIVKFRIPGDQIKDFHPDENTELEEHRADPSDVSKVEGKTDFLSAFLWDNIKWKFFSKAFIFMFSKQHLWSPISFHPLSWTYKNQDA